MIEVSITDGRHVINKTPHPIVFFVQQWAEEVGDDGEPLTRTVRVEVPPRLSPPRVTMERQRVADVLVGLDVDEPLTVPLVRTEPGQTVELPPLGGPHGTAFIIVSRQVAEANPDRGDLVVVDDTVRDEQGRIIGARGLASLARPDALQAFLAHRERVFARSFGRMMSDGVLGAFTASLGDEG